MRILRIPGFVLRFFRVRAGAALHSDESQAVSQLCKDRCPERQRRIGKFLGDDSGSRAYGCRQRAAWRHKITSKQYMPAQWQAFAETAGPEVSRVRP